MATTQTRTFQNYIDGEWVDAASDETFAAWPERLYVVAAEATLQYVGGPGPFAFDPDEAYAVLDELL